MATDALSAPMDGAQAKVHKIISCAVCGVDVEKHGAKQKYCAACAREVIRENRRLLNLKSPVENGRIGEPFVCDKCGTSVIRRHGCEKRCDDCKPLTRAEARKAGRPAPKEVVCDVCGQPTGRRAQTRHCKPCAIVLRKAREAAWRLTNAEKLKADKRKYHEENADAIRARVRDWRSENPDKVREAAANVRKNPQSRLRYAMSNGIRFSLRGKKAGRSWESLVDYDMRVLRLHLEKQFLPGMTWDGFGPVWHVDHIVPDSFFSYERPEDPDFKCSWALSNLRPLWALDNIKKNATRTHLV